MYSMLKHDELKCDVEVSNSYLILLRVVTGNKCCDPWQQCGQKDYIIFFKRHQEPPSIIYHHTDKDYHLIEHAPYRTLSGYISCCLPRYSAGFSCGIGQLTGYLLIITKFDIWLFVRSEEVHESYITLNSTKSYNN